ncbi:PIB2 [[Candida] subhashii]|uniref:PIB2 n=1 Tax=[Candida] subhashii TaxID=561895 RepID=A0A8J5QVG9_9ASCO|nr:PIB2 [[Candida] subhashii]KAG7665497.1 PIB2 [[Candida] subhashii]
MANSQDNHHQRQQPQQTQTHSMIETLTHTTAHHRSSQPQPQHQMMSATTNTTSKQISLNYQDNNETSTTIANDNTQQDHIRQSPQQQHVHHHLDDNPRRHHERHSDNTVDQDSSSGDEAIKLESSTELSFTKKDISKSRAQSFQSVLSTASLISLKQQVLASANNTTNIVNNPSLIRSNSTVNNSKNFQSFIQAPVLSSFTNLKQQEDEVQIGQQLPFDDKPLSKPSSSDKLNNNNNSAKSDAEKNTAFDTTSSNSSSAITSHNNKNNKNKEDDDPLIQQQNLTLKALKKLSLSPRRIINSDITPLTTLKQDDHQTLGQQEDQSKMTEPYRPAEVDLSSFASLTRQPKPHTSPTSELKTSPNTTHNHHTYHSIMNNKSSLPKLPEGKIATQESSSTTLENSPQNGSEKFQSLPHNQQQYQNQQQQQQQQQMSHAQQIQNALQQHNIQIQNAESHPAGQQSQQGGGGRIPAAVIPPQNMHAKRIPSNPSLQLGISQTLPASPTHSAQQPSQPQYQLNHPRVTRQLQQIKGLRSPMYVPCVLRRTQNGSVHAAGVRSYTHSPDIQPYSSTSTTSPKPELSYEQQLQMFKQGEATSSKASIKSIDSQASIESGHSLTVNASTPNSLTKFFSSGTNRSHDQLLRAPPTRRHWVKDETVLKCSMPACPKVFNFFERRHHCRKCGGIFCKEHTSHFLYINHLAQFTTGGRGTLSKVCDNCIEEYNEFIKKEFGVNVSQHVYHKPMTAQEVKNQEINAVGPNYMISKHIPKEPPLMTSPEYRDQINNNNSTNEAMAAVINNNYNDTPPVSGPSNNNNNNSNGGSRNEQHLVGSVPANWSWSSF